MSHWRSRRERPEVPQHEGQQLPGVEILFDDEYPEARQCARARLHVPEDMTPYGMEVTEREVVRGTVRIVYEIRCSCRRRWFQRALERVQVCPRCGRAVLVERPD